MEKTMQTMENELMDDDKLLNFNGPEDDDDDDEVFDDNFEIDDVDSLEDDFDDFDDDDF